MKLRTFDLVGIVVVLITVGVFAWNFTALRTSRLERDLTLTPEEMAAGFQEGVAWQGIYLRDAKIGFSRLEMRRHGQGVEVHSYSVLDLNIMRSQRKLELDITALLDDSFVLRSFDVALDSEATSAIAHGEVAGNALELDMTIAGATQHTTLTLDQPPSFTFNLRPAFMRRHPSPGKRMELEYFDPFSLSPSTMVVTYLGRDTVNVFGEDVAAHHLRQEVAGQVFDAWVNDLGEVLREELPLGVVAVRESEADATYGLGRGATQAASDLLESAAISAPVSLRQLQSHTSVRYQLGNVALDAFDLDGARQRFTPGDDALGGQLVVVLESEQAQLTLSDLRHLPAALAPELASQPLLRLEDEKIQTLSASLSEGKTRVREVADAVVQWVHDNVEKTPVIGIPSAAEVIRTRKGDCNEHAVVSVALLRSAGIPARLVTGVTYADDSFYYHAWLEYWDGRWVSADPTWGQHPADIGHLRFVIGGLDRQFAILRLLGTLRVEAATWEPS